MKIQVNIKNVNKAAAAASTTIQATVGPSDAVQNVQELIATLTNTCSFPDQRLLFDGKELSSNQRLSDCGVRDGGNLEFTFNASEATLAKQLSDIVGSKCLSTSEVGMMYCYRHAVAFEDALKALGAVSGANLKAFIQSQKCFSLQGDCVKLAAASEKAVQQTTNLKTIKEDKVSSVIEVAVSVELRVAGRSPELLSGDEDEDEDTYMHFDGSDTVGKAKGQIAAMRQIPFPESKLMWCQEELDDDQCFADAGVKNGSTLLLVVHASEKSLATQLEGLLSERKALSANELGLHYCQRIGTPVGHALRLLGLHRNLARFLEAQPQFTIKGGCVTLASGPELTTPPAEESSDY